jgi:glutaredoxin
MTGLFCRLCRGGLLAATMLALALALSWAPTQIQAEVYKWTDAQGNLHFSDKPPSEGDAERVRMLPINSFRGMPSELQPEAPVSDEPQAQPPSKAKRVVMYSAEWCGYCRQARRYFKANGIAFRERDVERDSAARREYERVGGSGLPLILVGERRLSGFSQDSFRRLYDR